MDSFPGRGKYIFPPQALKHARSHVVHFSMDVGNRFLVGILAGPSLSGAEVKYSRSSVFTSPHSFIQSHLYSSEIRNWWSYTSTSFHGFIYSHVANSGINLSNAELNPICHLLAVLGARHILHVSRIKVNNSWRYTSFLHITLSTSTYLASK